MKAISLWQPWASLVGRGKTIETRPYPTRCFGPLAIHAAKRWQWDDQEALCDTPPFREALTEFAQEQDGKRIYTLPLGAIVATCVLVDCLPMNNVFFEFEYPSEPELSFGNYAPGRFAWILKDIHFLPEPIPYRGSQGFFNVNLPELEEFAHAG